MEQCANDKYFAASRTGEGSIIAFPILIATDRISVNGSDGHVCPPALLRDGTPKRLLLHVFSVF
jgi:hypothetical protein